MTMATMTMATSLLSANRKRKGKNCCGQDVNLSKQDNGCHKNKSNCSGTFNVCVKKHKMMQMLTQLKWKEDDNSFKCKHLQITLLNVSSNNNNKPNRQKRVQMKTQMRFLCPWSNQIPDLFVAANNNKRSESVRVMILFGDVGEECHTNIGRTR